MQQHVLGQGPQDNESAFEQAKDEKISDCVYSPELAGGLVVGLMDQSSVDSIRARRGRMCRLLISRGLGQRKRIDE